MSFLSTLGKIGKGALHFATGDIGGLISDVGGVIGAGAKASKDGRTNDALINSTLNSRNNADALSAAQFNLNTPVTRAQQVAKGDLMSANIPQASHSGSGRDISFSGGIGPQFFGADTTQAGNELKRQALMKLMSGGDQVTPTRTTMQAPGLMEKIGGVAGTVGGLLGTLGQSKIATMGNVYRPDADEPNDENGWG